MTRFSIQAAGFPRGWPIGIVLLAVACGGSTSAAEASFRQERVLEDHKDNVYALTFSRDGTQLVSAGGDDTAIVWDVEDWSPRLTLRHDAPVYAAVYVGENQVVTASGDGRLTWWSLPGGEQLAQVQEHGNAVYGLAIQSGGRLLLSGGGDGNGGDTDGRLWNAAQRSVVRRCEGHSRPVYSVGFRPDGELAFTAGSDREIRIWKSDGTPVRTLTGHTSDVYRCVFAPSGEQLASSSQDGTVRLWDVASGKCLAVWQANRDPVYAVTFSADGRQLASVGDDGYLRIRDVPSGTVRSAGRVANRALYAVTATRSERTWLVGGEDAAIRLVVATTDDHEK